MKVLSIGLDTLTLNPESVVASRNRAYGEIVEHYSVLLPAPKTVTLSLSPSTTVYGIGGIHKAVKLWKLYKKAESLIRSGMCDVITSQDTYFLGLVGVLLSKKYHCGLEVQVLGIEKLSFIRKQLTKFVLQRAGSIRVLSKRLEKRLIEEFGISKTRMKFVPIYVDVSSLGFNTSLLTFEEQKKLEEKNREFTIAYGNRFNIVSVNRLVPIKNISMQLRAIQTLSKQYPQILLHIVGDGPLQEELEKEIVALGVTDFVVLHGFKAGSELSPFFTQSDCFVLTSDFEGYAMVVVEAATASVPIVMTDVGCAGEVVINEKSALIVPPKDTNAFIVALTRVIKDATLRETLAKEALKSIAELPSFDTVLSLYKDSWQQALENK